MLRLNCCVFLVVLLSVACSMAAAYPVNYLSGKLGASVTTTAKPEGKDDPSKLLSDGPVSKGGFVFARIEQPQVLTIDFGQERVFDRIQLGTGREPKKVTISVSAKSAEGPYRVVTVFPQPIGFQVIRLPLVKARWVRLDFGTDATGTHVHSVRIYKGYQHPKLAAVTKLLYERIKPGLPGLSRFYAAAKKGDWPKACRELRAYFKTRFKPEPPPETYDTSRAQAIVDGKLDYAGLARIDKVPIDWSYMKNGDWYEHRNFLNRGSPIGYAAQAYWGTGEKKWADFFRKIFYDWVDENPKPTVMSGADYPTWRTLDSAGRLGWIAHVFPRMTHGKLIDDELWANHLFTIWEHTDYIKNDNFTGGNWLAHSSGAVMGTALDYPEFKDQKIWLAYGKSSFETNVLRDIHPDGKEMEDAPGYVAFAYNAMLGTLEALEKAGIQVDPEARRRMDKVQDYLAAVTQPDGNMPAFGDWGGGAAYSLPRGQEYFKREDIKYVLTKGKEGKMPDWCSINFPQGQWSIMRSAFDEQPYENARHLVFKSSRGSHGHNDVLSITNYAYGRALLIDPGIKSYEHADVVRYTQTPYHNTITIDGQNQPGGKGKTETWFSNAGMDYVLGSHGLYKGLVHRRAILFVKPDYWVLLDRVSGEGEHTYDQNWHFAEDANIAGDPVSKAVHTGYASGGNLLILPVQTDGLVSEIKDFLIAREWMAPGKAGVESKGWKYTRTGPPPVSFDVLLYPYNAPTAPDLSVKRLKVETSGSADVTALEIKSGADSDYVFVSLSGVASASIPEAGIRIEGELMLLRLRAGKPSRLSGMNLKSVDFAGRSLVSGDAAQGDLDRLLQ